MYDVRHTNANQDQPVKCQTQNTWLDKYSSQEKLLQSIGYSSISYI